MAGAGEAETGRGAGEGEGEGEATGEGEGEAKATGEADGEGKGETVLEKSVVDEAGVAAVLLLLGLQDKAGGWVRSRCRAEGWAGPHARGHRQPLLPAVLCIHASLNQDAVDTVGGVGGDLDNLAGRQQAGVVLPGREGSGE